MITGSSGFIAKNLIATLKSIDQHQLLFVTRNTLKKELQSALKKADFLFHLAGVNRPENIEDFYQGNREFTKAIIDLLLAENKRIPIVFSSSIQAKQDNDYGKSKLQAEELLQDYATKAQQRLSIYRLPGVFGKWSKPDYNTVVATFCHRIANDLPIQVSDAEKIIDLVYIDDVIENFIREMNHDSKEIVLPMVNPQYAISLGELSQTIQSFKDNRSRSVINDLTSELEKKLFATYTSFLSDSQWKHDLKVHETPKSSFVELLKSNSFGQLSLNTIEPGAVRGNHWHHNKHEKFLVIQGEGIIRLRSLFSKDVSKLQVSGEHLEWIEIPSGMVHNIENVGNIPLVTIMWASEMFDPNRPDTYPEVV